MELKGINTNNSDNITVIVTAGREPVQDKGFQLPCPKSSPPSLPGYPHPSGAVCSQDRDQQPSAECKDAGRHLQALGEHPCAEHMPHQHALDHPVFAVTHCV